MLAKKIAVAATAAASIFVTFGAASVDTLAFEVASIKLNTNPDVRVVGYSISGTRVTASAVTLKDLVSYAYNLKFYGISGGPKWADSDRWNIEARAGGDGVLAIQQARSMMQRLLTERFHAKFHREMTTMSVYELLAGKSAARLKESGPNETSGLGVTGGSHTIQITATKGSMEQLVDQLSGNLDRPVVDKTRLTGTYDYRLEWTSDSAASADSNVPSIFTALREQLGLKLEPQKASIEVLVIDDVQRPSQN